MKHILLIAFVLFSSQSIADQGTESRVTHVPAEQMAAPSGSSGQAGNAMAQQMMGAGMNAAMGAQLYSQCMACSPSPCSSLCAMGAMSMAQAAMMMMSAGKSGDTKDHSSGNYSFDASDYMSKNPGFEQYKVGTTPDQLEAFISEGTGNLNNAGYSFDPSTATMTTPDGSFVVDESLASDPGALAAKMGGSAADMKMAENVAMGLSDAMGKAFGLGAGGTKASVSGMGFNSHGGGGGGSAYGSKGGGAGSSLSDYFSSLNRKPSSKDKSRMIAGKSKLLGNDSIGVSVDNIFAMVHRRYQAQRKANNFLEPIISNSAKKK